MGTVELIRKLRRYADSMHKGIPNFDQYDNIVETLNEAADRLEDLDERVAIMIEGCSLHPEDF